MNKLELIVYNVLKRNANLKLRVRDIYQSLLDFIPVKEQISAYPITVREGYFFGFHDKSPYSHDNKFLLGSQYHIPLKTPSPNDYLTLGVFEGNGHRDFRPLTKTFAWNWHQGCMLQWRGDSHQFIFNDAEKDKVLSRMCDISSGDIADLPEPVGAVSPDGSHAVGYSFSRVYRYMTGYGYQQGKDPQVDLGQPDKTGLYVIDLRTGKVNFLFSIKEIASLKPTASMAESYHFFSHCLFSPSSKRFVFMHRWTKSHKTQNQRWSRLISCDLDGNNLFVFPAQEMASHIAWRDDKHLLAYSRVPQIGDHYFLFQDQNEGFVEVVGKESFSSDGHPSFSPDKKWIVTDTYPNRTRQQYLVLFDVEQGKRYDIAKLKHHKEFTSKAATSHWSCDLHPRWDRKGKYLCFDSVFTGKRSLCSIEIDDLQTREPKAIVQ